MQERRNSEVIKSTLVLEGQRILDIGSGEGHLTRMMTRQGARVTGIECSARQLETAYSYEKAGNEDYLDGIAQDLPFEDNSIDIVVFFNSLHHVPMEDQFKALFEATRVLKTNGFIYVSEPIAEGPHFELLQPIDDETRVRAKAYECIKRHVELGLSLEVEEIYNHPVRRKSFEELREKLIAPNPEREIIFREQDKTLRQSFEKLGVLKEDGYTYFDQPTRMNLLKRID